MSKIALISVSNKDGIIDFAKNILNSNKDIDFKNLDNYKEINLRLK